MLGLIHGLVDAASALAVLRARGDLLWHLSPYVLIIVYDAIAFGLQAPLGALLDRRRTYGAPTILGVTMLLGALLGSRLSPVSTAIVAGIGNALFHVGAGAQVLSQSEGRATDAGIFVAPGAVGLAIGMALGKLRNPPFYPIAALLVLALGVLVARARRATSRGFGEVATPVTTNAPHVVNGVTAMLLLALLGSVFVRSFVGLGAAYQCPKLTFLIIGAPVAAFLGKCAGGYVADRLGWVAVGAGAVAISAPLVAYNHGTISLALLGVMLIQSSMPVSLAAIYRLLPSKPATAFGLPCLALVVGSAPSIVYRGKPLYSDGLLFGMAAASAMLLWIVLRNVCKQDTSRSLPTSGQRHASSHDVTSSDEAASSDDISRIHGFDTGRYHS
ncbi:MAG TPA: hypothetical protein VIV60_19950 [Polyangiaceae bacterium]